MEQRNGNRAAILKVSITVLLALLVALIALAPQAGAQTAPVDRRNVSANNEDNGLPRWYQDARGKAVFQCLSDQALCAIENPALIEEVVYWSGETSMPVGPADARGRQGQASLVMAVEGAFDPDAGGAPITGSIIQVRADGLRANTIYKVSHPYGNFSVRTNERGQFPRNAKTLVEHGCDIEPGGSCNFRLALRSPLFKNFLRWDPNVAPAAPQGYYGDPEVRHSVIGSLVKNAAGKPQNYFRIEGPAAGGAGKTVKQTNKFFLAGQKFRDITTEAAPPEEVEAE